jgi:uncharacterized Zn-finger protein
VSWPNNLTKRYTYFAGPKPFAAMKKKNFRSIRRDLETIQDKHMQPLGWYFPSCPNCKQRIPLGQMAMSSKLLCQNCNTVFTLVAIEAHGGEMPRKSLIDKLHEHDGIIKCPYCTKLFDVHVGMIFAEGKERKSGATPGEGYEYFDDFMSGKRK